jgi:hypothetical protein
MLMGFVCCLFVFPCRWTWLSWSVSDSEPIFLSLQDPYAESQHSVWPTSHSTHRSAAAATIYNSTPELSHPEWSDQPGPSEVAFRHPKAGIQWVFKPFTPSPYLEWVWLRHNGIRLDIGRLAQLGSPSGRVARSSQGEDMPCKLDSRFLNFPIVSWGKPFWRPDLHVSNRLVKTYHVWTWYSL